MRYEGSQNSSDERVSRQRHSQSPLYIPMRHDGPENSSDERVSRRRQSRSPLYSPMRHEGPENSSHERVSRRRRGRSRLRMPMTPDQRPGGPRGWAPGKSDSTGMMAPSQRHLVCSCWKFRPQAHNLHRRTERERSPCRYLAIHEQADLRADIWSPTHPRTPSVSVPISGHP